LAQSIGNPNFKYRDMQLSGGVNGPVCIFADTISPASFSDPSTPTSAVAVTPITPGVQISQFQSFARTTVNSADVGSLFLLAGVALLIKTGLDASNATSGTWQLVSVP
jgi:hypothetical protein